MSTVASLQSELKNLSAQSRRRNTELTTSSEKSLTVLDAVSQSFDSDREAISSLRKYPDFVTPFILACSEASAKSCASALQCIQNLAVYRGIAPNRLHELLRALMEATQLGLGIQLKILQVLPVLLFEFSADLSGELIVELLQVCAQLLSNNKVAMVHNAAYATLQQLVTGVFDRTEIQVNNSPDQTVTINASETVTFTVPPHLHDAAMILLDLCDIAEKQPPRFISIQDLPLTFTLELLELTLSNQASLIHKYVELSTILRLRITPLLLRLFSETSEFPIALRVTRIFYLLLRQHLDIVTTESEVILSTITQSISSGPLWKRALCLEVLQGIFLEANLVLELYTRYDGEKGRTDVMKTIISEFADILSRKGGLKLASELSADEYDLLIGNESNSTNSESASLSSEVTQRSSQLSSDQGIVLTRNSSMKQSVIDMLDRIEAPRISNEYAYLLILKSLNSIADDVHKLAPLHGKVQGLSRKLTTPLLKCFSVALGAAMDLDLYRAVVRSVQRLAHSSGILVLQESRDEFILLLNQYSYLPDDAEIRQRLLGRITLCVRALFNLGYALGNQLGPSWSLITDAITHLYFQVGGYAPSEQNLFGSNDPEYKVISAALRKLMDGSPNLSSEAIVSFMTALGAGGETIHFALLEELVNVNVTRFADPDSKCWLTLSNILLMALLSKDQRLAANVLNRSALTVMAEATVDLEVDQIQHNDEESIVSSQKPKLVHGLIIHSLCQQMRCESLDVRVHTIENLNGLLDKFGAKLLSGWEEIFTVVSPIPSTGELDLMRPAFRTLELVCSDFLDNLPYSCVFSLTLCLDEFSRQTVDLNTSFTSTSLFWSVCDHLMSGSELGADLDLSLSITEEKLVALARDESCPSKRYALWLLAVLKLAGIAGTVPQHQVRTGAIQIFLRLFSTHGHKLPSSVWSIAHRLAFSALLDSTKSLATVEDASERQETLCLLIEGVTKIYVTFMDKFVKLDDFKDFVKRWVDFLDTCVQSSPKVALSCYESLLSILSTPAAHEIPKDYIWSFWIKQERSPSSGKQSPKLTADALIVLVKLYPLIESSGSVAEAVEVISSCALFPYYQAGGSRNYTMSPLQQSCTSLLEELKFNGDTELLAHYMKILSSMALSPFEEPTAGNPNFVGLSAWAQSKLADIIRPLENVDEKISSVVPSLLKTMNKILSLGGSEAEPTELFLLLLDISPSNSSYDERGLVEGGQLILAGGGRTRDSDELQTIQFMEKFVTIIDAKEVSLNGWEDILSSVLVNSVLYERSLLTLKYFQSKDFDLDMGLEYGTVEPPKPLQRPKVAYYCLELLRRLASTKNEYAATARELYEFRIRAVLLQYIGDCRMLGAEPIRKIVRDELLFILRQLKDSPPRELRLERTKPLILDMLPRADKEVLPLLEQILKNENT